MSASLAKTRARLLRLVSKADRATLEVILGAVWQAEKKGMVQR